MSTAIFNTQYKNKKKKIVNWAHLFTKMHRNNKEVRRS